MLSMWLSFFWILGFFFTNSSQATLGTVAHERALYIAVFGAEMGVDREFNNKVLTLLAQTLVNEKTISGKLYKWAGKIGTYRLMSRGDEGGQEFCIEVEEMTTAKDVETILKSFDALKNEVPSNTTYNVRLINKCPIQ